MKERKETKSHKKEVENGVIWKRRKKIQLYI